MYVDIFLSFPCDGLGFFFLQVRNLLVGVWKQESFKDEVCEMPVCGVFIFFVVWFLLELKHIKLGFDFRIL